MSDAWLLLLGYFIGMLVSMAIYTALFYIVDKRDNNAFITRTGRYSRSKPI